MCTLIIYYTRLRIAHFMLIKFVARTLHRRINPVFILFFKTSQQRTRSFILFALASLVLFIQRCLSCLPERMLVNFIHIKSIFCTWVISLRVDLTELYHNLRMLCCPWKWWSEMNIICLVTLPSLSLQPWSCCLAISLRRFVFSSPCDSTCGRSSTRTLRGTCRWMKKRKMWI